MKFANEQLETMDRIMKTPWTNELLLHSSLRKLVEIRYVKHGDEEKFGRHIPIYTTHGVIENITQRYVYIINKNDCLEIIYLQDIKQMVEIKL